MDESLPLSPGVSVCPAYLCPSHSSPHPRSLPDRARGPSGPHDGSGLGGREENRSLVPWGPSQKAGVGQPAGPGLTDPLSPAPGRRGPVALVSEIFEQHLGGHILQVRPLPYLLLLAATWWPPRRTAPSSPASIAGERQDWEAHAGGPLPASPPQKNTPSWHRSDFRTSYTCQALLSPPCLSHSSPWMALCLP